MLYSSRHDESLLRSKIDRAVFEIDQESSFDHVEKFIQLFVLVPVIFTFDNSKAHDRVVHFAQRLVPPFVFAIIDHVLDIDQLERPVQNVQERLVGKFFARLFRFHL